MRAGPQLRVAKAARAPPCTLPILGRRYCRFGLFISVIFCFFLCVWNGFFLRADVFHQEVDCLESAVAFLDAVVVESLRLLVPLGHDFGGVQKMLDADGKLVRFAPQVVKVRFREECHGEKDRKRDAIIRAFIPDLVGDLFKNRIFKTCLEGCLSF